MQKLIAYTERTSRVLVWIGGGLILASAFLVTFEVALRKLFNVSIGGADELSGYAFGIATSFGFAYALFQRAHIRVDALYNLFPAPLKAAANLLGIILLAGFAGVVCVMAWQLVADTIAHNSHSITPMRTPLSLPQVPWLAGWLFFLFSCVIVAAAALKSVLSGDFAGAEALIGTRTIDEQVEDESV